MGPIKFQFGIEDRVPDNKNVGFLFLTNCHPSSHIDIENESVPGHNNKQLESSSKTAKRKW